MQYTSKLALLAVALFSTSALALPYGLEAEYDLEAREIDNDLSAREFYDMYLEARADPTLDARDLETLDFQARDYLDYLEARETDTVAPVTPHALSTDKTSPVESKKHALTETDDKPKKIGHKKKHSSKENKRIRKAKKAAAKKAKKAAKAKKIAVYLSDPTNLKKAYKNPLHRYHKKAVEKVRKERALKKKRLHEQSDKSDTTLSDSATSAATKEA